MNIGFLKIGALVAFLIAAIGITACGDTTMSDESAVVEATGTNEFYPFDEPPVLTSYEQPAYPEQAKHAGLEGHVAVKILVGIDGSVERVSVLTASDPIFETAALKAASECQFRPAKQEGKPTKSFVMVPFEFRLDS
jgi:TonB family protein